MARKVLTPRSTLLAVAILAGAIAVYEGLPKWRARWGLGEINQQYSELISKPDYKDPGGRYRTLQSLVCEISERREILGREALSDDQLRIIELGSMFYKTDTLGFISRGRYENLHRLQEALRFLRENDQGSAEDCWPEIKLLPDLIRRDFDDTQLYSTLDDPQSRIGLETYVRNLSAWNGGVSLAESLANYQPK